MKRHLGGLEQLLMLALSHVGDDASSVDIRECIEARAGRTISPGAIYTGLQRLERRGFVTSTFGDPTPQRGGKRKKLYTLRAPGARALADMQGVLAGMSRGRRARAPV